MHENVCINLNLKYNTENDISAKTGSKGLGAHCKVQFELSITLMTTFENTHFSKVTVGRKNKSDTYL